MYALICINQVNFVDILEFEVFTEGIFLYLFLLHHKLENTANSQKFHPFYHVFSNKMCKTNRMT